MPSRWKSRLTAVGGAVTLMIAFGHVEASADTTDEPTVRQCLDGEVAYDAAIAYFTNRPFFILSCGTPISVGVLHIDAGHPIEAGSEIDFLICASRLFLEGAYRGPGNRPGLATWDLEISGGRQAIGVYETETGQIVTIYVTGAVSNDWKGCARRG